MQTRKEPGWVACLMAFVGPMLLLYVWSVGLTRGGVQGGINYAWNYLMLLLGGYVLVKLFSWGVPYLRRLWAQRG